MEFIITKKGISIFVMTLVIIGITFFCYIVGYSLMIPLLLLFLGSQLYFLKKAKARIFLDLGLLLALIVFCTHAIVHYSSFSPLFVPVASISILTVLLFNDIQLAFMMAFASSIIVSIISDGDFNIMLTFFIGSLAGMYSAKEARTRGQLIKAGFVVSAIHMVCLALQYPSLSILLTKSFYESNINPLLWNGIISALLVAASLKIFEYLFGVLTNYSLLELSDFNQPLLKRMILEAPGTYHHSIIVGNLAEAAADAIGANALLTRVGAYYHDIGKILKPEYFTENQIMGGNKHDKIEPSVSRLVILNHVKEGIELAKRYKLNPVIIDFIPQHHGTSLIYYFYKKSLEGSEKGEVMPEENFRYPGPKPQTRETAITLLADSVEAAVRALDDPNPTNIEETVKKIVNNKFIDGQLDECNLTLKEINKISSVFTRVLSSMYHSRVKYPEGKNGNNNRESTEKNRSRPSSDKKDN